MQIESTRFGPFDVEADRALTFHEKLLGFPNSSTYVIIEIEDTPYVWLQSADEPDVAFLATSPFPFFPSYELELPAETETALAIGDPSQVEILTLLTVQDRGGDGEHITANLLGPIVINVETRRAMQVVLDSEHRYSTRTPLVA